MKRRVVCLMVVLMLAMPFGALAHEFLIKPVKPVAEMGETLPFSVVSAHVFMVSEEMEPLSHVAVSCVAKGKKKAVKLSENETLMTLDGAVVVDEEGTSIIAGHRQGMVWTQTTKGWKQAPKSECTGVLSSGKYEKFCKTLVAGTGSHAGYDQRVGHDLEIIPVEDPMASSGKTLTVKVLYKGKPISTQVFATYDGYSRDANTWDYVTTSDSRGLARIKVSQDGLWVVRVEKKDETATKEYDRHVMRAALVFGAS